MSKIDPIVKEMLFVMQDVMRRFSVDFFLVGAMARDLHLSAETRYTSKRKTKDVDLAVLLTNETQFQQLKAALIETGAFEELSYNTVKFLYQQRLEVDLLPFGDIEGEDRRVQLKGGTLLNLDVSGLREIWPFIQTLEVGDGQFLQICPLEGLVLLKLLSNLDNPSRTKDIADIEHILDVYFDLCTDKIFSEQYDVLEMYDPDRQYTELVAARVIGREMKRLLGDSMSTFEKLSRDLARRQTSAWTAMTEGLHDLSPG